MGYPFIFGCIYGVTVCSARILFLFCLLFGLLTFDGMFSLDSWHRIVFFEGVGPFFYLTFFGFTNVGLTQGGYGFLHRILLPYILPLFLFTALS